MAKFWLFATFAVLAYTVYLTFTQGIENSWVYLLFAGITYFSYRVRKWILKKQEENPQ
jgi:hypothetical protein